MSLRGAAKLLRGPAPLLAAIGAAILTGCIGGVRVADPFPPARTPVPEGPVVAGPAEPEPGTETEEPTPGASTPAVPPAASASLAPLPHDPMFWTFQEPLGTAAALSNVIEMVRVPVDAESPERTADRLVSRVRDRGLGPGEICLCLQNFGANSEDPALWRHPADAVEGEDAPWHRAGIAFWRAWTDRFIARWRLLREREPGLPDPARCHFDTERPPAVTRGDSVALFEAMRRDARWSREPVPGYGGRTMEDLHREAGRPDCDPKAGAYYRERNVAWAQWFGGICLTAADAAMEEAAYASLRAAFPGVGCSNWWTSCGFDGAGDPPRLMRWHGKGDFPGTASRGFAAMQSPVCYWADGFERPGESAEAAALRVAIEKVDAARFSWTGPGGRPHENVVPWIELTGNRRNGRAVSPELQGAMIDALRARGVREFLVWSDGNGPTSLANWNRFAELAVRAGLAAPTRDQ